jgi:hypothetical protein
MTQKLDDFPDGRSGLPGGGQYFDPVASGYKNAFPQGRPLPNLVIGPFRPARIQGQLFAKLDRRRAMIQANQ